MTDENKNQRFVDEQPDFYEQKEREQEAIDENGFVEETAGEVAPQIGRNNDINLTYEANDDNENVENNEAEDQGTRWVGGVALTLSILSLFFLPVLLGAAGLIVGFVARRRGSEGMGNWAIGIGAVSLIISLFITPFFF